MASLSSPSLANQDSLANVSANLAGLLMAQRQSRGLVSSPINSKSQKANPIYIGIAQVKIRSAGFA